MRKRKTHQFTLRHMTVLLDWIIVGIIIMKEQEQEKYRIRLIIYGMEW